MTLYSKLDQYNNAIADCLKTLLKPRPALKRSELVKALSKLLVDDARLPATITAQGKKYFCCSMMPAKYGTKPALYVRNHDLCVRGRTGLEARAQTYFIPLRDIEKIEVFRLPKPEDCERKLSEAYDSIRSARSSSSGICLRNRRKSSSSGKTIPELEPAKIRIASDFQQNGEYIS